MIPKCIFHSRNNPQIATNNLAHHSSLSIPQQSSNSHKQPSDAAGVHRAPAHRPALANTLSPVSTFP